MAVFIFNDTIAQVAHEANRAYCHSMGDSSQLPWAKAPEWQRESAMNRVRFHLERHIAGKPANPSESHNSHEELPAEQRLKDDLFAGIVAAFFKGGE